MLIKAELSSRLCKWVVELGQFNIKSLPKATIKSQVFANFIAEFSLLTTSPEPGYVKSIRKEEESSAGTLATTEPALEGPKVLKEPP